MQTLLTFFLHDGIFDNTEIFILFYLSRVALYSKNVLSFK